MGRAVTDRDRLTEALPALAEFLAKSGIETGGGIEIVRQFNAGQSNPTYLTKIQDRMLILRKQPYGDLLPKAHDVVREHDIIRAVSETGFPVPRTILASVAPNPVGTSFFLMEFVPGTVHSDPALPGKTPQMRSAIYDAMADTLAQLHRIDPSVLVAASVHGRPDYIGRQIRIWLSQYLASQTEPDDRIERVAAWLNEHKPGSETQTIVHGDYRIENLILSDSSVAAVLDWELCAIGEPHADLAYCCMWYHLPHDILSGLADLDLHRLGIPDEARFIERYASARGLDDMPDHSFFLAFSFYRFAAILQGVYKRSLDGNAASSHAQTRGEAAKTCLEMSTFFARS